jgi:hypothetical protein
MVGDKHVVDHRSLARSPPWAGRGGEVDRGSKGAKGEVGTAIDVPPQMGLVFHPTTPGEGGEGFTGASHGLLRASPEQQERFMALDTAPSLDAEKRGSLK